MPLSPEFLNEIAYKRRLSPDQKKVFWLRFGEEKDYEEISGLLGTTVGACLKRMGQVYIKFDIAGDSRGKESLLYDLLFEEYKKWNRALENVNSQTSPQATSQENLGKRSDGESSIISLEFPEGQVDLASEFYIKRSGIDDKCDEEILKPGALIHIKGARQMGKTSLMARIIKCAEENGYTTVGLTLQLAETKVFSSLESFLKWFCYNVAYSLNPDDKNRLDEDWNEDLGYKMSCTNFFRKLLKDRKQPFVLAIDDLDLVFQYEEIAIDFLGMLRAWHEKSKSDDIWKKFRLVMAHSVEVSVPLNTNESPFNVGLPINLPEFTSDEVEKLVKIYKLSWDESQIKELTDLVGGHPYLVRLGLYNIASKNTTLEELIKNDDKENSIYGNHLQNHLQILSNHLDLAKALKTVITNTSSSIELNPKDRLRLWSMGLVKYRNNNTVLSCKLYQDYFTEKMIENLEKSIR